MGFRSSFYKIGSVVGWINAFKAVGKSKSLMPLFRRIGNVLIGRYIVSKIWLRKRK